MSTLPPCEYEDSADCYWNAGSMGNGDGISFIDLGGTAYYAETVTPAADGMSHDFVFDPNSPIVTVTPPDGVLCYTSLDGMFTCNVFTGREVTPDDDSYVPSPPTGTETTTTTVATPPTTPDGLAETGMTDATVSAALFLGLVLLATGAVLAVTQLRNHRNRDHADAD